MKSVLLLSLAFIGCAVEHSPAPVPSTVTVQSRVQAAVQGNVQAGTNADRMERKAVIIDRWLQTHPQ